MLSEELFPIIRVHRTWISPRGGKGHCVRFSFRANASSGLLR